MNATAIMLDGEKTCTLPAILHEAFPIINTYIFHDIISFIAAGAGLLTLLISLANILRHLTNFTRPKEQRHIVRILLTPVVFSGIELLAIWFYPASAYLQPVAQVYEVLALISIFLLFLSFVDPDHSALDSENSRSFPLIWILVFQALPTKVAGSIAIWTTHALLCPLDALLNQIAIGVAVIESISTVICLVAILRFYAHHRALLKARKAFSKLLSFKLVVFVTVVQGLVFTGLLAGGVLKATKHISYLDWSIGVPQVCVAVEMLGFSVLFLWSFGAGPYLRSGMDLEKENAAHGEALGFFRAIVCSLNIWDIVCGALCYKHFLCLCRRSNGDIKEDERALSQRVEVSSLSDVESQIKEGQRF